MILSCVAKRFINCQMHANDEVNELLKFYMLLDYRIYSFERRPRLSAAPDWAPH
jgi:hypothetical protein